MNVGNTSVKLSNKNLVKYQKTTHKCSDRCKVLNKNILSLKSCFVLWLSSSSRQEMVSVLICKQVLFSIFNSLDKFSEAIQASNHPNKNKIDIKTNSLIARDDIFSDFSVELRTSFSFKITLVT